MTREEVVAAAEAYELPAYHRIDLVAVRGEGARLWDQDGTEYLDLYGGHAVALLGHSPARVVDAIAQQARDLLFSSNLVHLPARARAAQKLAALAPFDARVFFVNSGAEANETALKIARQATGRDTVLCFEGGFHGRTIGAAAACGLGRYREAAAPIVRKDAFRFVPFNEVEALSAALDETCAAVFVEPVQSMGGMHSFTPEFARALRTRCNETGAMLVFDEVQTAPARTGTWFAGEAWDVVPDLITTAKAIAAGFPAGAVLVRPEIAKTVSPGDQGTTFGGGPVACAAIEATLDVLVEMNGPLRAGVLFERARSELPGVEIRGRGALLGVVVDGPAAPVLKRLREEHRVLAGGCPGDASLIRLFPPLTITDAEFDRGLAALRSVMP